MVNITHKTNTLRIATAQATVSVSKAETIAAIKNQTVPKGNVLEAARVAGLFGVKKTAELIPDCHPLPIEHTKISYELKDLQIVIEVAVKTIYKTGVEVEAMHGASIVALTIYDMLKPIDKGVSISNIKLLSKKGGKSDFRKIAPNNTKIKAAVLVVSDSVAQGKAADKSGEVIVENLAHWQLPLHAKAVVPDEIAAIQKQVNKWCEQGVQLIISTGGTGLSPRDVTPEAIRPLLDKTIDGIMETARNYGQQRMPYAMLSRSVAGVKGKTLILTLPGSSKGVQEGLDALFPQVLHIFQVLEGKRH